MMVSDEIYDKTFHQMILGKKNLHMPEQDFEALVAELGPYVSPNFLSPNHRALNAEKKVGIIFYYLKDTTTVVPIVITQVCGRTSYMWPMFISLTKNKNEMKVKSGELKILDETSICVF